MSDIFDAMHRAMFDRLFSLDDEGREAKAKLLREAGVPEEMIAELTRPGIQPGMNFGGAKSVDVMNVVERVLFGQNAGHVLLRVKRKGEWLLIDENAPEDACIIARLQSEVEVLALREFYQFYLQGRVPEHFTVRHRGADYTVTPLGAPGEKLTLVIRGAGHSSTVATQFRMTCEGM